MTKKSNKCGSCVSFTRIKHANVNGICDYYDYTLNSDVVCNKCPHFKRKRFKRAKNINQRTLQKQN